MTRAARRLVGDVSVVDDARVDDRTLALALRKFGARVYFEQRTCSGHKGKDPRGRPRYCYGRNVGAGHAARCRGGREVWLLLDYKGFAVEVLGAGTSPQKAFENAVDRRSADRERWGRARR